MERSPLPTHDHTKTGGRMGGGENTDGPTPPNRRRRRGLKRWRDHKRKVQEIERKKREEKVVSVKGDSEEWRKILMEKRAPSPYP